MKRSIPKTSVENLGGLHEERVDGEGKFTLQVLSTPPSTT